MKLLLTFLTLFFSLTGYGQLKETERQEIPDINLIENPGFENGLARWTNTGGGTFATTSTVANLSIGAVSGSWDASAASDTLTSKQITIPAGLFSKKCYASMEIKGADTNLTMEVIDGSITVLASQNLITYTDYSLVQISFICPSSGTVAVRIIASANAAIVYIDQVFLGTRRAIPTLITENKSTGSLNVEADESLLRPDTEILASHVYKIDGIWRTTGIVSGAGTITGTGSIVALDVGQNGEDANFSNVTVQDLTIAGSIVGPLKAASVQTDTITNLANDGPPAMPEGAELYNIEGLETFFLNPTTNSSSINKFELNDVSGTTSSGRGFSFDWLGTFGAMARIQVTKNNSDTVLPDRALARIKFTVASDSGADGHAAQEVYMFVSPNPKRVVFKQDPSEAFLHEIGPETRRSKTSSSGTTEVFVNTQAGFISNGATIVRDIGTVGDPVGGIVTTTCREQPTPTDATTTVWAFGGIDTSTPTQLHTKVDGGGCAHTLTHVGQQLIITNNCGTSAYCSMGGQALDGL